MNNDIMVISTEIPTFSNRALNTATTKIINSGNKLRKNLFEIGVTLAKVDTDRSYEDDGFKSTVDYAMKTFGFKKSMAYSLMKAGREYIEPKKLETILIHEDGKDFSFKQLEQMYPLKDVELMNTLIAQGDISPDMSVRQIKSVVDGYLKPDTSDEVVEPNDGTIEEIKSEDTKVVDVERTVERAYHKFSEAAGELIKELEPNNEMALNLIESIMDDVNKLMGTILF